MAHIEHERSDPDWLLQTDLRRKIESCGNNPWLTLYSSVRTEFENFGEYCGIVPKRDFSVVFEDHMWDLRIGDGAPGVCLNFHNGRGRRKYRRTSTIKGVEPLVLRRSFHGLRPSATEILEEYRLFHNLWFDSNRGQYIRFDDDGTEDVLVEVGEDLCRALSRPIREFLALKEAYLILYFDSIRFSNLDIDYFNESQLLVDVKTSNQIYHINVRPCDFRSDHDIKTFSRLLGKAIIAPVSKSEVPAWNWELKKEEYAKYLIGLDDSGKATEHSCDPSSLSDNFGSNSKAPHFLTPVHFRKSVLQKYYSEPKKYSIEDGYLRCSDLWGLPIDNDHDDIVVVFLGDLSALSYREQLYWKSYNIVPKGTISETAYRRSILAEFADAKQADLIFKTEYRETNRKWRERFGWPLFLPLTPGDEHLFDVLHVPLTDEQREFDEQILILAKLLVDSLNEAAMEAKILDKPSLKEAKGISKLDKILSELGVAGLNDGIQLIRFVQSLRSAGAAHLKGARYRKLAAQYSIESGQLSKAFEQLLRDVVVFFADLSRQISDFNHGRNIQGTQSTD